MTGKVATSHKTPGVQRDFDALGNILVSLCIVFAVYSTFFSHVQYIFSVFDDDISCFHPVMREYFNTSMSYL